MPCSYEYGWSRPDDPARARAQQPGHRAYLEAALLRAGLEQEADPRELIRDYLEQRVEHGAVPSRADPAPCTRLDPTMPPTSFDIGFSLNPCPRKPGAPYEQLSGQVTCLDADYRTLAATLRARGN